MKRTNIYLAEQQTAVLDQLAEDEGISRAELIRRIIDQALNLQTSSLESDLSAIRDSTGALGQSGIDLPVRAEDDRERHLARIWKLSEFDGLQAPFLIEYE